MLWYAIRTFVRAGFTIQRDAVRCAISFSRVKRSEKVSAYCRISRRSDASCSLNGAKPRSCSKIVMQTSKKTGYFSFSAK